MDMKTKPLSKLAIYQSDIDFLSKDDHDGDCASQSLQALLSGYNCQNPKQKDGYTSQELV